MKKVLLLIGLVLLLLVGSIFGLRHFSEQGQAGYVVIGIGHWSVETSLMFSVLVLVISFVLLHFAVRLATTLLHLPQILQQRGAEQRNKRSQEALLAGLIDSAEGNFEAAEKHLIRHAANSGVPLINYLTAARAAQSRGALEQRDEYLKLAQETMPEAELAIGLTKVELQLSNQQFDAALESLTQLDKIAPSHAAVLKLMHQAYTRAEDWEGLSRLIPNLHANKVLLEAEIKLLETETYSALIKQKAASRDAAALRGLWQDMPAHIRQFSGVQQLYFAAMIEAGAAAEIEAPLRQALAKDWNETLLVLYGCIRLPDATAQLATAENWLPAHRTDAILLRVLGKLALRANLPDKASDYLQASLSAEASVEAYQLMGDLLLKQGNAAIACQYFRNGLLFAANEVVALIEHGADTEIAATAATEPAAAE